jgi:hypothetical protein
MSFAHLVIGLALLVAGTFLLARRQALARKEADRGRTTIGPAGWTVAGGMLALAGVLQVALAFL